ncbi:MAG: chloride channel protein [Candidatus Acidiferrales bacterium]
MKNGDRPRLIVDSVFLGIVGGLSAQVFMWMLGVSRSLFLVRLAGYASPGMSHNGDVVRAAVASHGMWLLPVATTLGGLISGILVYGLAPETEGHGTDTVVKAVHWTSSVLRARVAPVKMIASAITIGSGGSAGREGPTALIAAGFGSMYASILKRPERERRLLVLMGMAAGLSAIFRSPIGTAIFAVEVLYGGMQFESDALLYCMLSAIVAYVVNGWFVGWQSLFQVPTHLGGTGLADYGWYIALGLASGVVATALPEIFYRTRDLFAAIPIPVWIKPAIGGLALGMLALWLPQVLGGGYSWIQEAIDGGLALHIAAVLILAKMVAMSLTVSSGGSGGDFAPSLFVGAMLGATFSGILDHAPASLVVVGMAAVFGGAARVPIATLLMVAEMTGGYQLLVPAGLAVMISFLIQINLSRFLKYGSLYEAQVAGWADSPAHRAENVRMAIRLLNEGKVALPPELDHLRLVALLQSGLALDLPDGEELVAGSLRPESPWVGRSIRSRPLADPMIAARIIVVLRGKSVILPRPDTVLQPGDRLLLIIPRHFEGLFATHFSPISYAQPASSP